MGFDIFARDGEEEVVYLRAYMGAFRMCEEQGYDWFELIDAQECNGGVSGTGEEKQIKLSDLRKALKVLESHNPSGLASSLWNEEKRDEWTHRKPILKEFMEKCIAWCEKNKKESILIEFC